MIWRRKRVRLETPAVVVLTVRTGRPDADIIFTFSVPDGFYRFRDVQVRDAFGSELAMRLEHQ